MRVLFHPDFPKDVRQFANEYGEISNGLRLRFQQEIEEALKAVKRAPKSAGHLITAISPIYPELRRRNLRAFPFFILYGISGDELIFGSVIPNRSDPLTWLVRFK